jgi:hypothetical protein
LVHFLYDNITGIPTFKAYTEENNKLREQYGHRICQIYDNGISSFQYAKTQEQIEAAVQRGYEDMNAWLENYDGAAMEARSNDSFSEMCEAMDQDELSLFCDALNDHPQQILMDAATDKPIQSIALIESLQHAAKEILINKLWQSGAVNISSSSKSSPGFFTKKSESWTASTTCEPVLIARW